MSPVKKWRKMLVTSVRRRKNSDVIDLALCRLSGRASERGIRRSKDRFLMRTQNFCMSHARDKTKNIFLHFDCSSCHKQLVRIVSFWLFRVFAV